MKFVQPRVYLIASTVTHRGGILGWLQSLDGEKVLQHIDGDHAEQLIELAARRCYKAFDVGLNPNVTRIRTSSWDYHKNILESGHGSVLEHSYSTWAFEGVSRVFTHELVRNRAGNAFSQESLRYVRLSDIPFQLPPEIAADQEAYVRWVQLLARLEEEQSWMAMHFDIEKKNFSLKKVLTSMFRRVAPIGLATGIVLTCNMRSLRWLLEQRTSRHAEAEIRHVFNIVGEEAKLNWPMLFQDFEKVDTGDGENCVEWVPKYHKV